MTNGPNPTVNVADGIFTGSIVSELATVAGSASGGLMANFTVAMPA